MILTMTFRVTFVNLLLAGVGAPTNAGSSHAADVAHTVETVFRDLSSRTTKMEEAEQRLEDLPREEAIAAIVQMLKEDFVRSRWDFRELAYKALAHHRAAESPVGYEQLIYCLRDPASSIQQICCKALGAEAMAKELNAVLEKLTSPDTPEDDKRFLVKRLIGWEAYASNGYDVIKGLFVNIAHDESLRWLSARAMLTTGGLSRAVEDFQNLDAVGERVIMSALARFAAEAMESSKAKTDENYRAGLPKARDLVVRALKSPDLQTRKDALEALWPLFGPDDYVIIRSRTDYEWNPQLKAAFEVMAKDDPDPDLRENVARKLNPELLDQFVEKFLRARERQERRERKKE